MSKVLIGSEIGSYSFSKTNKTITFSGLTVSLERILLITDTTNNTIIYQFNDATKNGTLSNNVLTLAYNTNTGSFADTDKLQIFYWSEEPEQTTIMDLAVAVKRELMLLRKSESDTPGGKNVNVTNSSLAATVSAVTSLQYYGNSDHFTVFNQHMDMRNNFNNFKNKIIS